MLIAAMGVEKPRASAAILDRVTMPPVDKAEMVVGFAGIQPTVAGFARIQPGLGWQRFLF